MGFLQLLPCGRKASSPKLDQGPSRRPAEENVAPAVDPLPSRSTATAAAAAPSHHKRRRRAAGASRSGASSQWLPTLGTISEDTDLLRGESSVEGKGGTPRTAATATGRTRWRDYRDDYRHFTAPAVLPAFAPPAFPF